MWLSSRMSPSTRCPQTEHVRPEAAEAPAGRPPPPAPPASIRRGRGGAVYQLSGRGEVGRAAQAALRRRKRGEAPVTGAPRSRARSALRPIRTAAAPRQSPRTLRAALLGRTAAAGGPSLQVQPTTTRRRPSRTAFCAESPWRKRRRRAQPVSSRLCAPRICAEPKGVRKRPPRAARVKACREGARPAHGRGGARPVGRLAGQKAWRRRSSRAGPAPVGCNVPLHEPHNKVRAAAPQL